MTILGLVRGIVAGLVANCEDVDARFEDTSLVGYARGLENLEKSC
jgi:hypothetical protein